MPPEPTRPTARPRATAIAPPTSAAGSLPPLFTDPWCWGALAFVLLVLLSSLGAPFGEPVADDFDHLHYALFHADGSWLDGGGSRSFWRPLAYQAYYGLLHDLILTHPGWIAILHLTLLALAVLLLFDLARRRLGSPAAAVVASFPLLLESTRALLIVPVHFVDLGLIVFSVVAWHAAERGRRALALVALLAALLCKETAVATAAVLPWLAQVRRGRSRRGFALATAAVTAVWAATYLYVRTRLALALPHGLEAQLGPGLLLQPERYAWAAAGTARALVSLPMRPEAREVIALAATLLVLGAAAVQLATSAAARTRLARQRGWMLTGIAWFVLATGTLLSVYPVWSPERIVYASLGLGAGLTVLLAAAHPALPWALLAIRLTLFALAPAAPMRVTRTASEQGAFVDFERLVRLQHLMIEARSTLRREFPELPARSGVAMLHPPYMADYAAGDRALQVWFRDSTLRWVRWEQLEQGASFAAALEFQEGATPQFRWIEPAGLHALLAASVLHRTGSWQAAVDSLERADHVQSDREAHHFLGRVVGLRAWCLGALGHIAAAESLARQSLAIAPENADGHLTLATIHEGRREYREALAQIDTLLAWYPAYQPAVMMRSGLAERLRALQATAPLRRPPPP